MKKLRIILAVVLTFALLCLAGCASEAAVPGADNENIVGSWTCELDLTDAMNAEFASQGLGDVDFGDTPFLMYMSMEFNEDKSCKLYIDTEKSVEAIENYLDSMMVGLIDYMYETYESQMGMTRDEINEYFEDFMGQSFEEYVTEIMGESLNAETLAASFEGSEEGYYKLDNGKLYIADTEEELADCEDYVTYTLSGNVLTLDNGTDDAFSDFEDMGIELPLVFEKN